MIECSFVFLEPLATFETIDCAHSVLLHIPLNVGGTCASRSLQPLCTLLLNLPGMPFSLSPQVVAYGLNLHFLLFSNDTFSRNAPTKAMASKTISELRRLSFYSPPTSFSWRADPYIQACPRRYHLCVSQPFKLSMFKVELVTFLHSKKKKKILSSHVSHFSKWYHQMLQAKLEFSFEPTLLLTHHV